MGEAKGWNIVIFIDRHRVFLYTIYVASANLAIIANALPAVKCNMAYRNREPGLHFVVTLPWSPFFYAHF